MKKSWIFPINEIAISLTYVLPIALRIDHVRAWWWYALIAIELLLVPLYVLLRKKVLHHANTTMMLRLINVPVGALYFWVFGLGWLLFYFLAIGLAHYATTKRINADPM